jgi:hypothetical protein
LPLLARTERNFPLDRERAPHRLVQNRWEEEGARTSNCVLQ